MADFKPTPSQQAAIYQRGGTILVSAGAGSGKTKVLTERLMSFITDPVNPADVDSFLIITYTKAAAGELKGRIMEELSKRLANEPDNKHLRRQSALCAKAQIGTIHSFCGNILRENSRILDISPDFRVIDEDRAEVMKAAALERTMETHYENSENYEGFLQLVDTVGVGHDDTRLTDLVLELHKKMQCHQRPEKWAREQMALLSETPSDAAQTPCGQLILSSAADSCDYWSREIDRLMELCKADEKMERAYLPIIEEDGENIRRAARALRISWDKGKECFPIAFSRLNALRAPIHPDIADEIKDARAIYKKVMDKVAKNISAPSAQLLDEMRSTAPAMKALLQLALDFDEEYAKEKRRGNYMDYGDLEHFAAKLLIDDDGNPTQTARTISKRYTQIMVDEYQDVSLVQDAIFSAISRNGVNLFLVGDVKQSIYRFRLADPKIFTNKYLSYADVDKARGNEPRRIMLQENFRSRREILECANAVFSLCMSSELGDIDYDEDAILKPGADFPGSVPVPELMVLELKPEDEDEQEDDNSEDEESIDKTRAEAVMVGQKILELLNSGILIQGRPLKPGDIAILMRSANTVGGIYRKELTAMGIPVEAGQSSDYFESLEISTMLCLLAVLDNPHQDIPLIAVLRSPFFGFTSEELSQIRGKDRNVDFYSAVELCADESEKCGNFLSLLTQLRTPAGDLGACEIVWQLINRLDIMAVCAAMTMGGQRVANIQEFLVLAGQFDASGAKGLHSFVRWLEQLRAKGKKGEAISGGSTGAGGVQIMTVHKSKGLEFPVVFLSDTGRQFNMQDTKANVLIHPELGLGSKYTDLNRRVEYPTMAKNAIKVKLEQETLSEEMRLLYVALTRAKEYLFITGGIKDVGKAILKAGQSLSVPMDPEILRQARDSLHWLIYASLADGQKHLTLKKYFPEKKSLGENEGIFLSAPQVEEKTAAALKEIRPRLDYAYPYKAAQDLPSKVTATEIKTYREEIAGDEDEDAASIAPKSKALFTLPDFAKADKPLTGKERGIATHKALQYIDFGKTSSYDEIKEELERLKAQCFMSPREISGVNVRAVFGLFSSPLGERMRRAKAVHREFKFSLLYPADEIFPVEECDENVLLQGVIDCFLEEEDGLVLIDYKTDYVPTAEDIAAKTELYKPQLETYAKALERIYKKPVKESILYFLCGKGTAVEVK